MVQCEKAIESMLPKLHDDLISLFKLTMPMDRACNPTTVAELKDLKVLPENGMYETLDEEEAKLVFEKLKEKYPKLTEIESVPLPPLENDMYEKWHTKILRQIRAFNVHADKVVKAKHTILLQDASIAKAAKAKIPKSTTMAEFEDKTPSSGARVISRAS